MDLDTIWKVVKDVKLESSESSIDCPNQKGLYKESDIALQIEMVENKLSIKSSDIIFENITSRHLETAAEMFIYLCVCPNYILWKFWFLSWYRLYDDLFQSQSAYTILLTLNRMSHINKPENNFGKESARTLLNKASSLFTSRSTNRNSEMKGTGTLYYIYYLLN